LVAEIDRLKRLQEETRGIALAVFSIRVAPLELDPHKVKELFARSGLAARYGIPLFPVTGVSRQTAAHGGQAVFETAPEQVATLFRIVSERRIEAEKMLEKAKADLAAARAAVAAESSPKSKCLVVAAA
jgi:hypothetical protein